ncbi:response regulator [Pedobacter agri]|uniref:Response regulator n=1 Tax=Pedobacter agri TaxID=454586 RepID=A0A9X3DA75_9SPHI|nr:response regulator [Pedobacter agri]MCX3263465.1 response regulator [Pedobacter agri]
MKILVVDDHEIFRYGVKLVLESMCPNATVLEAENLDCAVNMIAAQDMRLIIFNANLTGADRLEALIRFIIKDSKVVIFSCYDKKQELPGTLLSAGASAFIFKDSSLLEIKELLSEFL